MQPSMAPSELRSFAQTVPSHFPHAGRDDQATPIQANRAKSHQIVLKTSSRIGNGPEVRARRFKISLSVSPPLRVSTIFVTDSPRPTSIIRTLPSHENPVDSGDEPFAFSINLSRLKNGPIKGLATTPP
jgi:hypothetical protein